MSDKLNAAFKEDPLAFLRDPANMVDVDGKLLSLRDENNTVRRFTLKRRPEKTKNGVLKRPEETKITLGVYGFGVLDGVTEHTWSNPLKGFWLPNIDARATQIRLDSSADYVFTPNFDGCTFGFETGIKPKVMHIDGAIADRDVPTHLGKLRDARSFGPREQNAAKEVARGKVEQPIMKDGLLSKSTVIGVRDGNLWRFYAQTRVLVELRDEMLIIPFVSAERLDA